MLGIIVTGTVCWKATVNEPNESQECLEVWYWFVSASISDSVSVSRDIYL